MSRVTIALVALAGILAGALGYATINQPAPQTDSVAVQAMIDDAITAYDAQRSATMAAAPAQEVATLDADIINPMIESFLMSDPKILQRVSVALDSTLRAEERSQATAAIATMQEAIFNDPGQVVVGNPDGDVTLVEFFDYNCGYCRSALPDLATLLAEDPNLRVIFKEFPILSNESIDAARIAVLVGDSDVDYWSFHEALFTSRGKVDKDVALAAAADLGLSPVSLELDMGTDSVSRTIQTSYEIAKALNITGTPTYIIGNEVIPGAIGVDELRQRIANMRECGETQCDS
ncbi:DsbA family protein [Devosia neptuniae]|mgnify:CR=1 FL=1|jgi:protein-disulfide isomerase|uniref:DsbA family protein n=3 Tax=Devosia TaxID=46913 RepID=UPI0022AE62ED|nr:DsbA family protein [Devosia neptuniae]MCZ4345287.1 DsbA family protein [Devosia neptuniae]|tara:strand:+ start:719 stop:1591 length:873 start_codon:yes stop_codon:yes gene_type:complete